MAKLRSRRWHARSMDRMHARTMLLFIHTTQFEIKLILYTRLLTVLKSHFSESLSLRQETVTERPRPSAAHASLTTATTTSRGEQREEEED